MHVLQEAFLEDINCLLNSGEVPDLFDNEELDGIAMELKGAASESQIPDTRASVYQFFISVSWFIHSSINLISITEETLQ